MVSLCRKQASIGVLFCAITLAVTFKAATAAGASLPNLSFPSTATGTLPVGWSSAIVVTKTNGAVVDSSNLTTNDPLFVDFAVTNSGPVAAGSFQIYLELDGIILQSFPVTGLAAGATYTQIGFAIGQLSRQGHTITVVADPTTQQFPAVPGNIPPATATPGQVLESDETDNQQQKSIIVSYPTPTFSSGTQDSAIAGTTWTYQITAGPNVTSYSATGLPPQISINNNTGFIQGSLPLDASNGPTTATYTITLTATNLDATATQTLTLKVVPQRPTITSALSATAFLNQQFKYIMTTTGSPAILDMTPSPVVGLTFDTGTGTFSGSPTQPGFLIITMTAKNDGGTDTKQLRLTIEGPPILTIPSFFSGAVGSSFSQTVTASGNPTFFTVPDPGKPGSLPAGLSIDPSSGIISGIPTAAGTTEVNVVATNDVGAGQGTFIIAIKNGAKPAITSGLHAYGQTGQDFYYQIGATDNPTQFNIDETQLPPGIIARKIRRADLRVGFPDTVTQTGEIVGITLVPGIYNVPITATYFDSNKVAQSVTQSLKISIEAVIPTVTSPYFKEMKIGGTDSYQVSATGGPTSYNVLLDAFPGLPTAPGGTLASQFIFNSTTGLLTGAPTGPANLYWMSVSATNTNGTSPVEIVAVAISAAGSSSITSPTADTATLGQSYTYTISGGSGPYTADLPSNGLGPNPPFPPPNPPFNYPLGNIGLTINAQTGVITGIPTLTGTWYIRLGGGGAFGLLKLTINPPGPGIPIITSANAVVGQFDTYFKYQLTAIPDNLNTTFTIGGDPLPAGLIIDNSGGAFIDGTVSSSSPDIGNKGYPGVVGPVDLVVTATNSNGSSLPKHITLVFYKPDATRCAISSALTTIATESVPYNFLVTATQNADVIAPVASSPLPTSLVADPAILSSSKIHGTPDFGSAATDPITLNPIPLNYWVMFHASSGGTHDGFGVLEFTVNPAPPVIIPSSTSIASFPTLDNVRTFLPNITQTVGLDLNPTFQILAPDISGTAPFVGGGIAHPYVANKAVFFSSTQVPAGLSMSVINGVINGTPIQANANQLLLDPISQLPVKNPDGSTVVNFITAQNNDVRVIAYNTNGADERTIQIGIQPVTITSINSVSATVGIPFSYQITATGLPFKYNATSLPPGLTIDTQKGIISGTPLTPSDPSNAQNPTVAFGVNISASNAWDTGSDLLAIAVAQLNGSPIINPPTSATGQDGQPFSYQISATNTPNSYDATGLPQGLSLNTATGAITGVPTVFGSFNAVITATNGVGTGGATLTLTIAPAPIVYQLTQPADGVVGYPYPKFTINATGSQSINYTVSNLPPGLTNSGANIIGTPTAAGTYAVLIHGTNPAGSQDTTITMKIYQLPAITSQLVWPTPPATAIVGNPFPPYTMTATGSTEQMVFTASPLPVGLSFDGTKITGVPCNPVTKFPVTLTAQNIATNILSNANNQFQPDTKTLIINIDSMQITNTQPVVITGTVGTPITNYAVTATGNPTGFSVSPATPLPRGLLIDNTGVISGTPAVFGTFAVTVIATRNFLCNGQPATTTANVDITIAISNVTGAPAITSSLVSTATVNNPFTYTITATNAPPAVWTAVPINATLPWLTVGTDANGNGLLTGTPPPGSAGSYSITLTATNGAGSGSAVLTLGVSAQPGAPAILSPLTATGIVGGPFTYQIIGSNNPTGFGATLNPSLISIGLNVTPSGIISGTPTANGTFNVTLTATNGVGQGSAVLVLTILPAVNPFISSSLTANAQVGVPFTYAISATSFPISYNATGLPPGLTVDTTSGLISGTPLLSGVYSVILTATNNSGSSAPATLVLTVTQIPGTPIITSASSISASIVTPLTYTITAINGPTSYDAMTLPPGLTVDKLTGIISGSPTTVGVYKTIVFASNAIGLGSLQVTFTIVSPFATITSATTLTGNVGVPFNYVITAVGNQPISFALDAPLPAGLTLTGSTIVGTPTTAGVTTLNIVATNSAGTTKTPLQITIGPPVAPSITSPLSVTGQVNVPFSYTITASGSQPLTFTVGQLPPGLLNPGGATISGVPTQAGSFTVPLTATFTLGGVTLTDTKNLVINIIDLVPGVDTDGDCYPDDLEIALGSNPLDPTSTPFGLPACNGQLFSLPQPKLSLKLDFTKTGNDNITLTGTLPVPPGFSAPGQRVVIYIGGVIRAVTLGAGGVFNASDRSATVSIKANSGAVTSVNARYSIKLHGSFQKPLSTFGLTSQNTTKQLRQVPILLIVGSNVFQKTQDVIYTARAGHSGAGR